MGKGTSTMNLQNKIIGAVSIVVIVITLLAMTPTVVDQVQGLRTADVIITGETLGAADNATTQYYFDYPSCKENSETIYQNTTEVTNYIYIVQGGITGITFTEAPNSLFGSISADYTQRGWDFTGAEGAIALLGLVPFIWIASILIAAAVGMFALAKA